MNLRSLLPALLALVLTGCGRGTSPTVPPVLLLAGTGTSPHDVEAIGDVLRSRRLDYTSVDSFELNAMSGSQLATRRLLIVPGGNYLTIGKSLEPATPTRLRDAVRGGLNYLGICAGGLLAGDVPQNG